VDRQSVGPDPGARLVRVVPDIPAVHRRFDYSVPPALDPLIRVGSRVRIELHGRRVGAWVVEDRVEGTAGISPKPLSGSSGDGPPESVVSLAVWAAWRWAGPVSSFLGTASPKRVVRGIGSPSVDGLQAGPDAGGPPLRRVPPSSPGGGSVQLVDGVLGAGAAPSVVRLGPALDGFLVVLELLHRTGSGGVLVLVPSHARAGQLADRLRRSGQPVALMPDQWALAATGSSVVIGTRAAAWAPIPRVRAVVVLDAHDEAYREERSPTWSAVDVVVERGQRDQAEAVALITPCPPVTVSEGRKLITTARAVERRGWPVIELVDRTGDDPRTGLFSERMARVLHGVLERPEGRVVCVLNRTGRARLLACGHCGTLVRCTRCGGAMAQHDDGHGLRCRRCGATRPAVCAHCDSTRLKSLRIGVTRATEELSALSGIEAVEITSASSPEAVDGARLIVGTEAALHRVPRADVVILLDIDQHLLAPRFGAGEETLALLARASRLVGGRDGGGRVLVQTRIPDHEALRAAVHADPGLLAEPERELRRALDLPPFGALAVLRGPGASAFASGLGGIEGLTTSMIDDDRWLVRAPDHGTLCDSLGSVPRPPDRLRIEVDPTDA
jgi:primosomal protein N' (replication factor Y) (superfamily II helicase)